MTREWKPGDVAMVLGPDEKWRVSIRALTNDGWLDDEGAHDADVEVAHVRPLVVIDPEDRKQVGDLMAAVTEALGPEFHVRAQDDAMQAALRSLVAPPRIDEPGTWGVVEAACVHTDERAEWVRWSDGNWYRTNGSDVSAPDDWDSLVAPTLIREGVA